MFNVMCMGGRREERESQKPKGFCGSLFFPCRFSFPGKLPVRRRRICYVLGLSGSNRSRIREEFGVGGEEYLSGE